MKISFNWLRELVALPAGADANAVAERLTLSGLEVESVERRGREVRGVRVAEVRAVRPHPDAAKLRIVRLTIGEGEEDVVCGAPNVPGPGGRVAWAPPGAVLPGGVTLGRKEIRGVLSPGMICSEKELGIGEGVDGILILSPDMAVGADLAQAAGIVDDVLDVNVTPNRADALSHAGIAREVAALFGVKWRLPELGGRPAVGTDGKSDTDAANEGGAEGSGRVDIRDAVACPRYRATVIRDVRVGPSPLWMRLRLAACGVRAISNLVDVTNYVMLETGHPLHAFDLDKLAGGIVVRRASAAEELRTLDGIDRRLDAGDIVIADHRAPKAIAGVMGGADSEISPDTRAILLEAATFEPASIRRTAKRLGLRSEASYRFERGVDAETVGTAGDRAATLMASLAGGTMMPPTDVYPGPAQSRSVRLSQRTLSATAGFDIPIAQAAETLERLEIATITEEAALTARIPSFRRDLVAEEDLIEEVMRLVGYGRAPARLPAGGPAPGRSPEQASDLARDALAALGLLEIASWAFVPRSSLVALADPKLAEAVALKNPLSADYEVMRTSLLPGLATAAARNVARGVPDVRLFEVGPVILPLAGDDHHRQETHAAGLLVGRRAGWLKPGEPLDFFDAKRVVLELLRALHHDAVAFRPVVRGSAPAFHPGVSAEVLVRGTERDDEPRHQVGVVGELHPVVGRRLGLEVPALAFELVLDGVAAREGRRRASSPPRYPAITRDLSFWIDAGVPAGEQDRAMRASGERLLRDLAVLEDFRDPRYVPEGRKGMLWTMTYRADDRTLTDGEADAAHARVIEALKRQLAIEIR